MEEELKKGLKHVHPLYSKNWVVYAKKPLPSCDSVVEYISRYSHRIAISNHRIKEVKDGIVTFSWINYRTNKVGLLPLMATVFLHRFLLHVLPAGFIKIRHYGILSTRNKTGCIALVRELFGVPQTEMSEKKQSWIELYQTVYGNHPKLCPCCNIGIMVAVETFLPKHLFRIREGPPLMPNLDFCMQKQ